MISLVSGFQLLNTLRTGHLQLYKNRFLQLHILSLQPHILSQLHT